MQDAAGCSVFELVALVKQRVETASNVQCSSLEKDYSAGTCASALRLLHQNKLLHATHYSVVQL